MGLQQLYLSLPVCVQEAGLSLYARYLDHHYYGGAYAEWVERFEAQERLTAHQQRENQLIELHALLHVALHKVPYIRDYVTRRGLREDRFTSLDDLRLLPYMDKDSLRQDRAQFMNEDYPGNRLWEVPTGGTTGKSVRVPWPLEMLPRWWALHEVRVRHWAGVSRAMPRAMVGGRQILRGGTTQPPFWRYNRYWRQLYMSSYHIAPSTVAGYIAAIGQYGSTWITGYPSAIGLLGEYLVEHPAELPIHAVVTTGETVSPSQRQVIEGGFRCRMVDYYGAAEGCCVITECEHGRLHVQPEAGILEILDAQGEPCPPGVDGEFVCTALGNDALPLIRYRIGDYGSWAVEQRCPCGRQSPLVSHIMGRTDDYLLLPDGRRIGRLSPVMRKAATIAKAQFVQDTPTHAWLLIVPEAGYRDDDSRAVIEEMFSRIGERVLEVEVRLVREIPPTPVGKRVLVRRILERPDLQEYYRTYLAREAKEPSLIG